jgi:integrase
MGKTKPRRHNKEQLESVIKEAYDNEFYFTLFTVAKSTGRRLGEYLGIRVRDIAWNEGLMFTPILKRRESIVKPARLTPETQELLKQYIARNKLKEEDYLFRARCKTAIQKAIKVYAKRARDKGNNIATNFSFHNFRHYFVTELSSMGWSHEKISRLTGHLSPSTLVKYDSTDARDIKDEESLNALKAI